MVGQLKQKKKSRPKSKPWPDASGAYNTDGHVKYVWAARLAKMLHYLPKKDQQFVLSLLKQYDGQGNLSEKQWYWVGVKLKLAQELATNKKAIYEDEEVYHETPEMQTKTPAGFLVTNGTPVVFSKFLKTNPTPFTPTVAGIDFGQIEKNVMGAFLGNFSGKGPNLQQLPKKQMFEKLYGKTFKEAEFQNIKLVATDHIPDTQVHWFPVDAVPSKKVGTLYEKPHWDAVHHVAVEFDKTHPAFNHLYGKAGFVTDYVNDAWKKAGLNAKMEIDYDYAKQKMVLIAKGTPDHVKIVGDHFLKVLDHSAHLPEQVAELLAGAKPPKVMSNSYHLQQAMVAGKWFKHSFSFSKDPMVLTPMTAELFGKVLNEAATQLAKMESKADLMKEKNGYWHVIVGMDCDEKTAALISHIFYSYLGECAPSHWSKLKFHLSSLAELYQKYGPGGSSIYMAAIATKQSAQTLEKMAQQMTPLSEAISEFGKAAAKAAANIKLQPPAKKS